MLEASGMFWLVINCLVMIFYILSAAQVAGLVRRLRHSSGYNYRATDAWSHNYPTCSGQRQSPIDLNPDYFQYVVDAMPLRWTGYDNTPDKMTFTNSGHSLELRASWPHSLRPHISGGPLRDDYVFEQLHFHWGRNNSVGSEHTAHGTSYPLEMHMVHWKREYQSFNAALQFADGLAVVAAFFAINNDPGQTAPLNAIFNHIVEVREVKSKVELMPFPLSVFEVVETGAPYMMYYGSLTTPPCNEVVYWIIPNFLAPVSDAQMEALRSVKLSHGDDRNYRPIQPNNDRALYLFTNARVRE